MQLFDVVDCIDPRTVKACGTDHGSVLKTAVTREHRRPVAKALANLGG